MQLVLLAAEDRADRARDLARHERRAAPRRLVVEEDPVDGVHAVRLAVVARDPVAEDLARRRTGCADGTASPRSAATSRHLAEHLARRRLVEAAVDALLADRVEQAQRAERVDVGGVLRDVEAHAHVALRAEVVDLVGPDRAHQLVQHRAVGEIAEDELDVAEDVVDARGVERARAADHPVDLVALLEQDLGEIRAVLARDPGDERFALRATAGSTSARAAARVGRDRPATRSRDCAGRRCARSRPRSRRPA